MALSAKHHFWRLKRLSGQRKTNDSYTLQLIVNRSRQMSLTISGKDSETPSVQGLPPQGNRPWAQIVGRSRQSMMTDGNRRKPIVIWEEDNFQQKDRAMQASAALQRALRPGGSISILEQRRRALLEVNFVNEEETKKAIQMGLELNGIMYKGTPTVSAEMEFTQVRLHDLYLVNREELAQAITNAMDHFDYETEMFEGEATVILDRTIPKNMPEDHYADLDSREIYFLDWDDIIQATFKGCPPKCRYCGGPHRHIRRRCPFQKEQRAQKKKHTSQSNFEDLNDGDMLDAYERKKQKMKEKEEDEDEEDNVMVDVEAKNVSKDLENNAVAEAMTMDAIEPQDSKENGDEIRHMEEVEEDPVMLVSYRNGSTASIHNPATVSSSTEMGKPKKSAPMSKTHIRIATLNARSILKVGQQNVQVQFSTFLRSKQQAIDIRIWTYCLQTNTRIHLLCSFPSNEPSTRMEDLSQLLPKAGSEIGTTPGRSFCHTGEQTNQPIRDMEMRPTGARDQCHDDLLETPRPSLSLPTVKPTCTHREETTTRSSERHSDHPLVAVGDLVSSCQTDSSTTTIENSSTPSPPRTRSRSKRARQEPTLGTGGVEHKLRRLQLAGASEDTTSIIMHPDRRRAQRRYGQIQDKYLKWCQTQNLDPQKSDGSNLINFLAHGKNQFGWATSTIENYRSVLLELFDNRQQLLDSWLYKSFFQALNEQTIRPLGNTDLDISPIIAHFHSLGTNHSLTTSDLTAKLCWLLGVCGFLRLGIVKNP
ncbi:hypothetical protein EC973_006543 [Apophysomyces ossiformis]|uniref:CCHC-type domain-containing protein n=1 Tax=Apophysomyces ossiformis TaxID=679940 RepID=A0A8H7BEB4_9FUNG|nr:hypothetical protein EC973_006543 [Apophysomyces ossiformis]